MLAKADSLTALAHICEFPSTDSQSPTSQKGGGPVTWLTILGWIGFGLLALLVLVFLLLLPSLRLHFSAREGEVKLSAHYLFLRYRILPAKDEKPAKKAKKAKKPETPPEEEEEPEKEDKLSLSQRWQQYRPLIRKGGKVLRRLCKRVVIYKVRARVKLCGEDAHQTALKYAKVTSGAAVLFQLLEWAFTLKKTDIGVAPDFLGQKDSYDVSFRLRVRPVHFVTAGAAMLVAYLKASRRGKKIRKGGKKYERATTSHQ